MNEDLGPRNDPMAYFDRQGQPITFDKWCLLFVDKEYQQLKETRVGDDVIVSTVWLGHNMAIWGRPLIFETMVFGGPLDQEQWRYHTEAEALAGHDEAVELAELEQAVYGE